MTEFKSAHDGCQPRGHKAGLLGFLMCFSVSGVFGVPDHSPMVRRPQTLRSKAMDGHSLGQSTTGPRQAQFAGSEAQLGQETGRNLEPQHRQPSSPTLHPSQMPCHVGCSLGLHSDFLMGVHYENCPLWPELCG